MRGRRAARGVDPCSCRHLRRWSARGSPRSAPEILLGDERGARSTAIMSGRSAIAYDPELVAPVTRRASRSATRRAQRGADDPRGRRLGRGGARRTSMRWASSAGAAPSSRSRFMIDPTWRAYVIDLHGRARLCRAFVGGDPAAVPAAPDRAAPTLAQTVGYAAVSSRPWPSRPSANTCSSSTARRSSRRRASCASCASRRPASRWPGGDGRRGRRRPRRRGRARRARRATGARRRHRALAAAARARRRDRRRTARSSPSSRRGTSARRSRRSRPSSSRRVENFRFYASAIALDRAAAPTRSAARSSSTR